MKTAHSDYPFISQQPGKDPEKVPPVPEIKPAPEKPEPPVTPEIVPLPKPDKEISPRPEVAPPEDPREKQY